MSKRTSDEMKTSLLKSTKINEISAKVWEAWQSELVTKKAIYNKMLEVEIVGKSTIIKTPNSSLFRFYGLNGTQIVRFVVWSDQFSKVGDNCKIGNCVFISGLKVTKKFLGKDDKDEPNVWTEGELTITRESSFKLLHKATAQEHPMNAFNLPPFYRQLAEVLMGDTEIAGRATVLSNEMPTYVEEKLKKTVVIGDDTGTKMQLTFGFCDENDDDKQLLEGLVANAELLFHGAIQVSKDGMLALEIERAEYITIVDIPTLKKMEKYNYIPIKTVASPPKPKKSRSTNVILYGDNLLFNQIGYSLVDQYRSILPKDVEKRNERYLELTGRSTIPNVVTRRVTKEVNRNVKRKKKQVEARRDVGLILGTKRTVKRKPKSVFSDSDFASLSGNSNSNNLMEQFKRIR
ncbi:hypothetical protein M3Y95_00286300 [Aphelenchoides besseyi]|nr:hypothetical protein M3Y95_00286300 [Aphelenchoides besseyi]